MGLRKAAERLSFDSHLEFWMDFEMPWQTAVRLHEECPFIDNAASRGTQWKSWFFRLFVWWWSAFSRPASFSHANLFWQHLANLINDSISASSEKEKIKLKIGRWYLSCGQILLLLIGSQRTNDTTSFPRRSLFISWGIKRKSFSKHCRNWLNRVTLGSL